MLQNLLKERLGLSLHREARELTSYDLVVGKNGSKLKASELDRSGEKSSSTSLPSLSPDGFPVTFPGRSMIMRFSTGHGALRMAGGLQTTEQIALMLTDYVGGHVVDKTGLAGKYDFHLEFAGDDSSDGAGALVPPGPDPDSAPGIFEAVREQLGLVLEKTRLAVDVLVIDHIEKTPTDN